MKPTCSVFWACPHTAGSSRGRRLSRWKWVISNSQWSVGIGLYFSGSVTPPTRKGLFMSVPHSQSLCLRERPLWILTTPSVHWQAASVLSRAPSPILPWVKCPGSWPRPAPASCDGFPLSPLLEVILQQFLPLSAESSVLSFFIHSREYTRFSWPCLEPHSISLLFYSTVSICAVCNLTSAFSSFFLLW